MQRLNSARVELVTYHW